MEFGEAVHTRRKSLGLTLADLSERCGTSRAMLSEIEACKKNPTLPVACSIAQALDCQISDLLDLPASPAFHKLIPGDRRVLVDPTTGVERHLLAPPMVQHGVQVLLFVIPAGATSGFPADPVGVVEHATVVKGRVRVELGELGGECECAELEPGESVNYVPRSPHRMVNLSESEEARVFVVIDWSRQGEPVVFGA